MRPASEPVDLLEGLSLAAPGVAADVDRLMQEFSTVAASAREKKGCLLGRAVGPRDWGSAAGKGLIAGRLASPAGR